MNCAKRSCSAQAACALPCAWPLPGLISVNGIMIRRIMLLMGPDLPLNFHPAAIRVSAGFYAIRRGWSNVRSAELFGVAQPVARCGEVGGISRPR
jgi:hypothetical protein